MVEASMRVAWRIHCETGVMSMLTDTQPGPRVLSFAMQVGVRPGELTTALMKRLEDRGMRALLQAELNAEWLDIQQQGAVYRFSLPNPRPFVLPVTDFIGQGVCVPVGLDRRGEPVDVDFARTPHVLIAGPTNMGKTNVGRVIAFHLAQQNSPRDLRMVAFTASLNDWRAVAQLPHFWGIVYHDDALQALEELRQEGKDRKKHGPRPPRIVVFLDDMKHLVTSVPNIGEIIDEAARNWRDPQMHLVILAQGTTAEDLGGPAVDKNIVRRLVGTVASAGDAARMTGRAKTGAEQLLGTGEAISVGDGPTRAMTFAKVEDRDFDVLAATMDQSLVEVPPWETGAWRSQWSDSRPSVVAPPSLGGYRSGSDGGSVTGDTSSTAPTTQNRPVEAENASEVGGDTSSGTAIGYDCFPLPKRPPTPEDAAKLRWLRERHSQNKTLEIAYGGKNSRYIDWLKSVMQDGDARSNTT